MNAHLALAMVSLFAAQEAVAIYCLPTLIALVRWLPNRGHIAVINMYLGWTIIAWAWALIAALRTPPSEPAGRQTSGEFTDADLADRSAGEHP